jgi:hypothetical protein
MFLICLKNRYICVSKKLNVMINIKFKPTIVLLTALFIGFLTLSWGIVGHERINKAAVMALPKPLQVFFTIILIL